MTFTYQEVAQAYENLKPYLPPTPLVKSFYLGQGQEEFFFKLESMQVAKSFKIRGALNKMLSLTEQEIQKGVATISSGNHGSSVSYAASLLGIKKAVVIVPETAPQSKIDKIRYFGAQVMLMGKDYDQAHELGMAYIEEQGMTYIDAYYDDIKIYGGQGTVALEMLEQNPELDTLVIPIGGGGLITGMALAAKEIKPEIQIIGVQTEACPAMLQSLKDKVHYKDFPSQESICDALVGGVGALSYQLLPAYLDHLLLVSEEAIGQAVSFMARQEKFIAEAGSCTTIAAVQQYPELFTGKKVGLVISGGNIDGDLLTSLLTAYPQV